jgi:hypothetical protein
MIVYLVKMPGSTTLALKTVKEVLKTVQMMLEEEETSISIERREMLDSDFNNLGEFKGF